MKNLVNKALESKFNNALLLELNVKNQVVLFKEENKYVISKYIVSDKDILFGNIDSFEDIKMAVDCYTEKSSTIIVDNDLLSLLDQEIKNIKNSISFVENSLEKIERIFESFSPNLFGEDGCLSDYKKLNDELSNVYSEGDAMLILKSIDKLKQEMKDTLGVDLEDIENSLKIIEKAKIKGDEFKESLIILNSALESAILEYENISRKLNSNNLLFSQSDLLGYINQNTEKLDLK
ncbi:hypothetical protein [Aliarcobacter butzleri]|uniref:hypothetical protein n=1 Tax=Aliarcobacter butzleri TaxID=28197 RepID=UPI002B24912C|nr:hypothetical protein [Aliarcobacter butzleri]